MDFNGERMDMTSGKTDQFKNLIRNKSDISSFYAPSFQRNENHSTQLKSKLIFGKCRVCEDYATGVHYGVPTCEGCKGFFKRSTMKNQTIRCFFGNACNLTPKTRNNCKACRLAKCIQVGMSIEGVKMGRIPKVVKEKGLMVLANAEGCMQSCQSTSIVKNPTLGLSLDQNQRVDNVFVELDIIGIQSIREADSETKMISHASLSPNSEIEVERLLAPSSIDGRYTLGAQYTNTNHEDTSLSFLDEISDEHWKEIADTNCIRELDEYLFEEEKSICKLQTTYNQPLSYGLICSDEVKSIISTLGLDNITIDRPRSQPIFPNPTNHYESSMFRALLNDKVLQLFNEKHGYEYKCYERARALIQVGTKTYDGHDAQVHEIWQGLLESIRLVSKVLVRYAKEMPGFAQLSKRDFDKMTNKRLYDYILIKNAFLFIDGEYYWQLPNGIQYSRANVRLIIGEYLTNLMFDFEYELDKLKMTKKELTLMIPVVISRPDSCYENADIFELLHQYYKRAIYYEFDINRRDNDFIQGWIKLLEKLKEHQRIVDELRSGKSSIN